MRITLKELVPALTAMIFGGMLSYAQSDESAAPPCWTRASDGNSWVWTLEDSEGKGAAIIYRCRPESISLRTRESLLDTADADDMNVKLGGLGGNDMRTQADGVLAGDHHGVRFEGDNADALQSWLYFDTSGQQLTVFLSGSGKRLVFIFMNRSSVPDTKPLSCGDVPKPKKK